MLDRKGRTAGGSNTKRGYHSQREGHRQNHGTTTNDDTTFMPASEFPSAHDRLGTRENPVNLSDGLTEASNTGACPEGVDHVDKSEILGHFSDTLSEMASSIMELEDGYSQALCEVIMEMEKALQDISCIDTHYVSHIVTVMASWQEAVQAAVSHMENADLTIYLACREDARRATKEYINQVIQVHVEHDAAHTQETEAWKKVIKTGEPEDPVLCLLDVTCKVAHAQAERVVEAFLTKIQDTLWKHMPVSAQGPLVVNALSTAFQFQMSVWRMIRDECVWPLCAKHSDWCGLVGIMQAIVETFPRNCAIMFPPSPTPAPVASFSVTFKAASSDEVDDNDLFGPGLCRFDSDSPTPSGSGCGSFGCSPNFSSTPPAPRRAFCPGD